MMATITRPLRGRSSWVTVAARSTASAKAASRTQSRPSLPVISAARVPTPKLRSRAPKAWVIVCVPPYDAGRFPIQPRTAASGLMSMAAPNAIRPTASPLTSVRMTLRKTQVLAQRHRGMTALLGLGGLIPLAAWIAYYPGPLDSDSASYADLAVHGGMSPTRQMAYPWIMRALILVAGQTSAVLGFLTAAQHLATLVVGVLVYAMLRRLEVVTWLAVAGAAVFVLDAFTLSIDQTILSEGFYVLTLTASFALVVLFGRDPRALFFSGLLLAASVWLRSAGLFAIPAWGIYVAWTVREW